MFSLLFQDIPTFVLVFFRVAGLMLSAPLFGSAKIPRRVKLLLAIVLAFGLARSIPSVALPTNTWVLAVGIGGELIFGIAMGMALSFTFIAVNWAGEIIGQQMGINLGEVFDPQFGKQSSLVGDLYFMLTLVIFLLCNGHHNMLRGIAASFDKLPLLSVGMNFRVFDLIIALLGAATILAMQMAAPMLLTMLITDLALGFISKTMPQINVMTAGTSMKTAIGVGVLLVSLSLTSDTIQQSLLTSLQSVGDAWVNWNNV
jgi:flagellar biosynthetic protein FliR